MVKERGGKAQVAFRNALGIRGDQDAQFQEIKVSALDGLPRIMHIGSSTIGSTTYEPSR
jgi:hypothetical protein